jgi:DNA repair protein RadC
MHVKISEKQKIKVVDLQDVYLIMQQVLLRENKIRRSQEHFWVIGLNNVNKILFVELVSLGASNRVQVHPPEVFRMAIYKLAVRVILVHNHPSGQIRPTAADMAFTDKMIKVGELIHIEVLDHLVISETTFSSFEHLGLMAELRRSDSYRVLDREQAELKAMQLESAKSRARKDQAIEMAKLMLAEGLEVEMTSRISKLTKKQVERLAKQQT